MRYPLSPRERIGILVICACILFILGWIIAAKSCSSSMSSGVSYERVFRPDSVETGLSSPSDKKHHRRKSGRKKSSTPHRKPSSKSHASDPNSKSPEAASRDFLNDSIPSIH